MGMSKEERELRAAFKEEGSLLYHHLGYYTLVVYDYVETKRGDYVLYFNADNCDNTYKHCDGAFIKQESHDDILHERWFNENILRCSSVERLLEKKGDKFKLSLEPAQNPITKKPVIIDVAEEEEIELG